MKKRVSLISLIMVAVFLFSLPAIASGADKPAIKIGVIVSMIGPDSALGAEEKKAFDLAFEILNQNGGIKGYPVEMVMVDGQSKPATFALRANRLLEEEVLIGIGGEDISFAAAAGQVFQDAKTPFLDLAGTTPTIALVGDFVFMNPIPDNDQARAIAKYAVDKLGYKKFTIFRDVGSSYGTMLTDYLLYYLKEFTGDADAVPFVPSYNLGDTDFSSQITRLKTEIDKNDIEVIILPTWPDEAPLIAKQCRDLGITLPFIGTDGADTEILTKVGGKSVEGMLLATHFDIEMEDLNASFQNFASLHKKKYGEHPGAFGALTYDAVGVAAESLALAIEEKGEAWWDKANLQDKRIALKQAILKVSTVTTSQKLSFDEKGRSKRGLVWRVVKDGKRIYTDFMPYSAFTPKGVNLDPLN